MWLRGAGPDQRQAGRHGRSSRPSRASISARRFSPAPDRPRGLAAATCNRRVQMLASAFKLGLTRKRITAVPTFRKLSEAGNAGQGFFEADEVERVIVELPDHLRDLTRFCYLTSWRKAEARGLKWESVDLKGRVITLPTSKNGKRRSLALAGEVLEILKRREAARLVERNGEPRVSDQQGHGISDGRIRRGRDRRADPRPAAGGHPSRDRRDRSP